MKSAPFRADIPKISSVKDLPKVTAAITSQVAEGKLTPTEGEALAAIIDKHIRALELTDIETRIANLEGLAR